MPEACAIRSIVVCSVDKDLIAMLRAAALGQNGYLMQSNRNSFEVCGVEDADAFVDAARQTGAEVWCRYTLEDCESAN